MFPNPRLLKLTHRSRPWLILTISLGFLSGVLTLLQARAVSRVISKVFLDAAGMVDVQRLLIAALALFTGRAVLAWGSSLSGKTIAVQVKSGVRDLLLEKLEQLGPAYLGEEQSGEISHTAVEGVEALDAYFSQYLPQLVLSALVPLTILFFVFPMDFLSGSVLLVTAPLIPYFMYLIGGQAKKITDEQYGILSRLAAGFLEGLQGLKTLKLYNQARNQIEKIRRSSDQYRLTTMKVLRVTFLSALVLELLATLSTAVVAVQIGLRLLYFRVSFEQALFLLMIAPEFYIPLRALGLRFHAGMEGQSAADRIFKILDTDPLAPADPQPPAGKQAPAVFKSLEIKNLDFRYPGDRGATLQSISFVAKAGEKIALVGASGAGKTTLASALLGFFPPSSGEILVNGASLADLDRKSRLALFSWVPQNPSLFQGSIAENIRLAQPGADDGAVAAAASAAHLAEWIAGLPEGYETPIGQAGARLSGGQAQRLALARAFLKDAPILLLDEPTSQLDPATETQLADSTQTLMAGRTVITIAHRLNTIYQADRILVMRDGKIVESGTHQELLAAGGYYKELVAAYTQASTPEEPATPPQLPFSPSPGRPLAGSPRLQTPSSPSAPSARPPGHTRVLKRLLTFFKPHLKEVAASVLLGTITIASSIGLMGASAWIISTAALHPSVAVLQVAIVGVRFFGISRGISRYLERLVSHNLTFKILTRLRVWFYESLVPLAPARTQGYQAGDLLSRIISDVKTLEDFYVRGISPALVAALIGLGTGVFLYPYHPGFALILGIFFTLSGAALPLLVRFLADKPGVTLVQVRTRLTEHMLDFIQGLPDLLAFGRTGEKQEQIKAFDLAYAGAQLRLARISGLNAGALILFSNLASWLILVLGITQVESGALPGVMLAPLALLALSAFEAVQTLPAAMETLSSSLEAAGRLFEVLDAEPSVSDPAAPESFPPAPSIRVRDLSFSYPSRDDFRLDGIDLELISGQILAIVGPSGSGKSTLGNILLRFWGGYEGEILLGEAEIDLRALDQAEVRRHFSVISQDDFLFRETVRANIALGKPGADEEQITAAAKKARIHSLISSLPEGYQTQVGERGQLFSAGETQRISIARAVLKDAPLFLLDEPTANLDPINERALLETLFQVLEGKSALLITHRLVGLDRADQILVLDQGRIVERGTERDLLAKRGYYHWMWTQQNRILGF